MASSSLAPTLGRRFVLIVLLCAVLPLGAIGLWVTRGAARSGRSLLESQLRAQLAQTVRSVGESWAERRSELMTLAENEPVRLALLDTAITAQAPPEFVQRAFARMTAFDRVDIRDRRGRIRFTIGAEDVPATNGRDLQPLAPARGMNVSEPIIDLASGDTIGTIDALLRAGTLVPQATQVATAAGPLTAVFAAGRGTVVPVGADEQLFMDETVSWREHHWLTVRASILNPPMQLAIAGTLDPYVAPFEGAATRATITLVIGASAILLIISVLTRRMTREVERELAQREALAAVGEFASELAHEVRNPLTAIRLDLQRVEEVANDAGAVRGIVPRVLRQIDRLDRSVTGALRVARGGSMEAHHVDLREVLESARRAAEPEFARRGARVFHVMDGAPERLDVDGDAGALEQLFLNLLINAAQALAPAGEARLRASRINGSVEVTIVDTGAGMTPAQLEDVGKPFRSSRRDGTGLGLKIARRIVASHHGEMEMVSSAGEGTTVRIRLPSGGSVSPDWEEP